METIRYYNLIGSDHPIFSELERNIVRTMLDLPLVVGVSVPIDSTLRKGDTLSQEKPLSDYNYPPSFDLLYKEKQILCKPFVDADYRHHPGSYSLSLVIKAEEIRHAAVLRMVAKYSTEDNQLEVLETRPVVKASFTVRTCSAYSNKDVSDFKRLIEKKCPGVEKTYRSADKSFFSSFFSSDKYHLITTVDGPVEAVLDFRRMILDGGLGFQAAKSSITFLSTALGEKSQEEDQEEV